MGMGEPLANYTRVVGAVRRLTDPARTASGFGQRNVVVSTVGLVPAIQKLTEEGLQVTLALSLHAPDDELRDTLVPVNTRWPVREVLAAALGYTRQTGRRLSIEYAMIRGVNDQPGGPTCSAGCCAASSCTSTSSRSTRRRAASGTPGPSRSSASSCAGCAQPACDDGARHPRAGDRRRLRAARRRRGLGPSAASRPALRRCCAGPSRCR